MTGKTPPAKPAKDASDRDLRLKAALQANLARRKAQARARDGARAADKPGTTTKDEG